jgi:hypothetical protein
MVRKIRDEQAALLASKSNEEVVEYFRKAGQRVIEQACQARASQPDRAAP